VHTWPLWLSGGGFLQDVQAAGLAETDDVPSDTWPGSGSTLTRLARTLVPSQSMTAGTNGTGIPGAARETMVNARTSPSVSTGTRAKLVPLHAAQALRRSKNLAPHASHWLASRWGLDPRTR
jgi:hypothetical protein